MKATIDTLEKLEKATEDLEQYKAVFALINRVREGIAANREIQEMYKAIGDEVRDLFQADTVGFAIYSPNEESCHYPYTYGDNTQKGAVDMGMTNKGWLGKKTKLTGVAMTGRFPEAGSGGKEGMQGRHLTVPIMVGKDMKGVISIGKEGKKKTYDAGDEVLLSTIAGQVGMLIHYREAGRKMQEAEGNFQTFRKQLIQQEKLAGLGKLMAGIAHEVKNPLNFVNNFSDLNVELIEEVFEEIKTLDKNETVEEIKAILQDVKENLLKVRQHGMRADSIVKSMLKHSRGRSSTREPTDLNALIKEYVNLSFHGMRAGKNPINVGIDLDLDEQLGMVPLIGEDFSRIILNLCSNAFDAMREKALHQSSKGGYTPRISIQTSRENGQVKIEIKDNGPGIPGELKDKILQPFFTTKKAAEGTGLGLSIVQDIIKAHGGRLEINTRENSFTQFTIFLSNDLK